MVMIVSLVDNLEFLNLRFESDVISDGTQAIHFICFSFTLFESDVISDGTQAKQMKHNTLKQFESDVISDGTQAYHRSP